MNVPFKPWTFTNEPRGGRHDGGDFEGLIDDSRVVADGEILGAGTNLGLPKFAKVGKNSYPLLHPQLAREVND
jgi:hypothetical protein